MINPCLLSVCCKWDSVQTLNGKAIKWEFMEVIIELGDGKDITY